MYDKFAGKPSKEMLKEYFKLSRQYFDDLAKRYYVEDREYYDKFIAPFYSPFSSKSPKLSYTAPGVKPSGSGKAGAIIIAVILFITGLSAALFFVIDSEVSSGSDVAPVKEEQIEASDKDNDESIENYNKALKYYNNNDYENAEKYFKLVKEDSDKYKQAQQWLRVINEIKKSPENPPNKRRQPRVISPG